LTATLTACILNQYSIIEDTFMTNQEDMIEGGSAGRKARERERHRQEILTAAERVFAGRGFHATTMELIAREAEFSVGTLYNFFDNKDALYAELMDTIAEAFLSGMEQRVLPLESAVDALRAMVDMRLDFMEQHRGLFRMVLEQSSGARWHPSGALPKKSKTIFDLYLQRLIVIVERGIQSGEFDPEPALYQALAFDGMVNAFTLYWSTHTDEGLSREQARDSIVNRFLKRQEPRKRKGRVHDAG
jgi:AcrR family transcriptional regulator